MADIGLPGPGSVFAVIGGKILGRGKDKSPGPIDVALKQQGKWDDPDALQVEAEKLRKVAEQPGIRGPLLGAIQGAARANLAIVNARLVELENQGQVPEDDFAGGGDESPPGFPEAQAPSPVFPGLNPFAFGLTIAGKELRDAAAKASKAYRDAVKKGRKTVRAKKFKFAKGPLGKSLESAEKLLKLIPKWALPDADVVKLAKQLRGATWPAIAGLAGEFAIKKASEYVAKVQFAKMEKILGPENAALAKVQTRLPKAKPPKAPRIEPPRPSPPPPPSTGTAGVIGKAPRPPKATASAVSPPVTPAPQKVPAAPVGVGNFPAPARQGRATTSPVSTIPAVRGPVRQILIAFEEFEKFRKAAQPYYDLYKRRTTNPPKASPFVGIDESPVTALQPSTSVRPLSSYLAQSQSASLSPSNCYTVCRKKSSGKKKRKPPRVCVSQSKARAAGIT